MSRKNDDVENLKAELAHLKKKIQQVVMEDNQINSEKKSVEIDDIFAGTLEIGARVLSMGAVKLTELGDIAFSTGKQQLLNYTISTLNQNISMKIT